MEPVRVADTLELEAPPGALWEALSNTDRLNRALGLPPVRYTAPPPGGVVREAESNLLGPFALRWDEHPFDWVERRRYRILRVYHGGPLERFEGTVSFEPSGTGTRVGLEACVAPRWAAARPLARVFASAFSGKFAAAARRVSAAACKGECQPLMMRRQREGVDHGLLRRSVERLAAAGERAALERLVEHLETADDVEAGFMRPFELADDWKLDRLEVLRAFLRATKAGLLDLRWELLCPNCRVAKKSVDSLKTFHAAGRCEFCNVDFSGNLDENVELRFSPNASVRAVSPADFCIGGPGKSPHRRAQLRVPPGGRTEVMTLPAERHVLRGLAASWRTELVPDPDGPERLEAPVGAGAGSLRFKPGAVTVALKGGAEESWAVIETEAWGDKAVTAAFVTTLQDFRDLFSSEVLTPGAEVSVRTLAILFTDLKGSTAMYERVGDARAYGIVRGHFEVLFEAVKRRRGAVVKTIGDAVMAAFLDPADAAAAALDMHAGLIAANEELPEPVVLKVGIHAGPAIAINAEGVLDYFGTTVNLAARVQSESAGGDLVVTKAFLDNPKAAAVLAAACGRREEFSTTVRGLRAPVALFRLWPEACLRAGWGPQS